ncbi:MAG: RNA methyltransferase [Thermanaerothrix sp.]|nr:RNA methyltransferase [Thermanaerothrix sp.]
MWRYFECRSPSCAFRFPAEWEVGQMISCPRCGGETRAILPAHESAPAAQVLDTNTPLHFAILDNLRSAYNVGSIFRTADACGIRHLYLCGITPLPTHPGVKKTALGAEENLPWSYAPNSVSLAQRLKREGHYLIGVETASKAQSLFEIGNLPSTSPWTIVVGNEVTGIDPELQTLCNVLLWIPMQGYKRSLNVAVAFGIVAYFLRYFAQTAPKRSIDEALTHG